MTTHTRSTAKSSYEFNVPEGHGTSEAISSSVSLRLNRLAGEQKENIRARVCTVGQKHCCVSFHDLEGTMHMVEVTADSLYEAVARGMKALQSKEWSGPGAFQIGYVDVTVSEPEVTHRVNVKKFNEWLERSHGSPRETVQRQKVQSILNG